MCANHKIHNDCGRIRLFAHHTTYYNHFANLSESIELLKPFSGTFCRDCVSKIKSIISIFHTIYMAVRIQIAHFSYVDCENVCTLSYYHHQIRSMIHLPLFMVR